MHSKSRISPVVIIVFEDKPRSPRPPQSDRNKRKIVEFVSHCHRIPRGHWSGSEKHHVSANPATARFIRVFFRASNSRLERGCYSRRRARRRLPCRAGSFRAKEQPLVLSNRSDATAEVLVLTRRQSTFATRNRAHRARNGVNQIIASRVDGGPRPAGQTVS
jgi:hypothetical protein